MRRMSGELTLAAAAGLVGLWLALLFLGHIAGGLIHLMPAIALALVARLARKSVTAPRREIP
jgi:hypothetical protein